MSMSASRLHQTIFECLLEAQSKSDENKHRALQMLVTITKVSPQNRNLLAQTDGAVQILLRLFKSESPTLQLLSLSVLFNLSLNNNLKLSLADMQTIYHLNYLILSPALPESNKLAASLICSLAMLDKNKAKFGVGGTIDALVKAVSGPRGPVSHHLLSSLAELVQFHGNCTVAVRSGVVKVLLGVVESIDDGEDLAGTSLAILGLLARFDEGLNGLRRTDGIVSKMLEVLKGRCMISKEGAADILLRLLDESEGCLRDALGLEFSSVLADLSIRGSSRAREKAGLLMKKMVEADMESYMEERSPFSEW